MKPGGWQTGGYEPAGMKTPGKGDLRQTPSNPGFQTHLFIVRVWHEDLGDGKSEWRGQVKHVLSGEVRYFRGWQILIDFLKTMLCLTETNLNKDEDQDYFDRII